MEQDQEPTADSNTVKSRYCHLLYCAKRTGSKDLFIASMINRLNIHVKPQHITLSPCGHPNNTENS